MQLSPGLRAVSLFWLAMPGVYSLRAQTPEAAPAPARAAEVTTKDTPVTFRSGTNLVPVSVVVRDSKGHAVGNLQIEDFQLFDNGKPQMISKFSVERIAKEPAGTANSVPKQTAPAAADATPALADANPDGIPDRFVAYLFDDIHISPADLVFTRNAARRQIDASLEPLSRVAIYTTSGHSMQEFTSDRGKLHAALDAISANQYVASKAIRDNSCPPVDYYMADRIYNYHDLSVWKIATKDALSCGNLGSTDASDPASDVEEGTVSACEISGSSDGVCKAVKFAKEASHEALIYGDRETDSSLDTLRAVINRMTSMPGQRSIVLISPGFLVLNDRHDIEMGLIDRAIKAKVVIGGLDARGLYSQIQGGDASDRVVNSSTIVQKIPYQALETVMETDVVANLAEGTGGTFYQGTNDFDEGFARVAATPDFIYVLGFSPLNLKLDGKFHTLKVTLKNGAGVELQVRKGYYAPKYSADPADQAKQKVEEAFFSRDEIHDLPAILQTQYFKTDNGDATLSTVAKIDIGKLTFRKEGDRNRNDITVVTGLFDNDGNYVTGAQKVVEMRLLDETLQKHAGSGFAVKNSFSVHPGRYVVRMVVRDSEGQLMSAQSSLVEIP